MKKNQGSNGLKSVESQLRKKKKNNYVFWAKTPNILQLYFFSFATDASVLEGCFRNQ